VEADDFDVLFAAEIDGGFEELFGVAVAAGFGGGVEVEEVGAAGFEVHPVGWKLHEEDTGAGEDLVGCFVFEEEADVGAVGEVGADPGFEGGVHFGKAAFVGEVVVGEHDVAVLGDEGGVGDCGAAERGHKAECRG